MGRIITLKKLKSVKWPSRDIEFKTISTFFYARITKKITLPPLQEFLTRVANGYYDGLLKEHYPRLMREIQKNMKKANG